MIKRIISFVLCVAVGLSLCIPAGAAETETKRKVTEQDFLEAIANGTAKITSEGRAVSSYTIEEINADPGLAELFAQVNQTSTRSLHSYNAPGATYSTTVTLGSGDTATYRLYPYCSLVVDDVGTASGGDISTTLMIAESITVNGQPEYNWDNYIHLKNVSVSMGCGKNSSFSSNIRVGGNAKESSVDTSDVLALIGTAVSLTEYVTVAAIISAFSLIDFPSNTPTDYQSITSNSVRAIGASWGSNIRIQNSDHRLWAESRISTKDSNLAANVTANAVAEWNYDVYYGVGSIVPQYANQELPVSGTYLVNVK